MKIATVLGARPQFIKAAALSRELKATPGIQEIIIHTGQHYDENMSAVFFQQMQIPEPDYNLNIKSPFHGMQTGQMMTGIEEILLKKSPDLVLVYGDTNSTLAGALAAAKLNMPVAHVEAGLRSFNMKMPEEINRVITDRISSLLFCPGEQAMENLRKEGLHDSPCEIHNVGDIMKDVAHFYQNLSRKPGFDLPEKFILATLHRAENTDDEQNLTAAIEIFNQLAETTPVVLPLHPRTRKKLKEMNSRFSGKVLVVEPVGYLEMVHLLTHCEWVITDSGGLQKEAYYFKKYCVTVRSETEWVELVQAGFNFVTGFDRDKILTAVHRMKRDPKPFNTSIYGQGDTAKKIAGIISESPLIK